MHIKAISDLDNDLTLPLRDLIFSNHQKTHRFISEFIKAKNLDVDEAVIEQFSTAFETFIHGVFDWRLLHPDADLDMVVPMIWRLFWNGSRFV